MKKGVENLRVEVESCSRTATSGIDALASSMERLQTAHGNGEPPCPRKLRPSQTAVILGTNTDSVRIRLQQNLFSPPIGTAHRSNGSCRFVYEVYPEKLAEYLNISVKEVFRRLNESEL